MNLCTKDEGAVKTLTHLWTVEVRWGNKLFTHKARNATDAFEWADCYPADADVHIIASSGPLRPDWRTAAAHGWPCECP